MDLEVRDPRATVAGRLVEEVVPVPGVELGAAVAVDEARPPVVGLEVEALRRCRGDARRLLREEVDHAELGDILPALVVIDAERVGFGMGEAGAEAGVLQLAVERVGAVPAGRRLQRAGRRGAEQPDGHDRRRGEGSPARAHAAILKRTPPFVRRWP